MLSCRLPYFDRNAANDTRQLLITRTVAHFNLLLLRCGQESGRTIALVGSFFSFVARCSLIFGDSLGAL